MNTIFKFEEQFGVGMKFQAELNRERDEVELSVWSGESLEGTINMTTDQFNGLIDFMQNIAVEYLEKPADDLTPELKREMLEDHVSQDLDYEEQL